MPTVTLHVELISVATEILAFPGDQLMVHGGVVLGVAPKNAEPSPRPNGRVKPPAIPNVPNDEQILTMLSNCAPITSYHLASTFSIPVEDKQRRQAMQGRVDKLIRKGLVQRGQGMKLELVTIP